MIFYAHTKEGYGEEGWQTIKEHAENVAELCNYFSRKWCASDFARNLGLLHDIGKYQEAFQKRIRGNKLQVEHAVCGASECKKYLMEIGAYCIAGHHAGLPDCGTPADRPEDGTLYGKLKRKTQDFSAYIRELNILKIREMPIKVSLSTALSVQRKQIAFWLRMMFSALVDADYLDTEQFCSGKTRKAEGANFALLLQKLYRRLAAFPSDSEVQRARQNLLAQALSQKEQDAGLYVMNMPTGSGKTLASMCFAMERALRLGLKRIIYVIPYTSIIEQNAQVFRDVFGEAVVLEHHCNYDYESLKEEDTAQKLEHAAENWDVPIVVTTNVRFFESIYGNKPSQMRKLHNIAESMLVFDEVHMFPSLFYQPCLEAIKFLVEDYGCRALFLSATMPDFSRWLTEFDCDIRLICDLIEDKRVFPVFERCLMRDMKEISAEKLISEALKFESALIVVNTRKAARALYEQIPGEKYHLSTYMTKLDRSRVIKNVKEALRQGRHFLLVSTSLIEAGVDLDFAAVFRERAGIDNLLQAAGRCNREGKRTAEACAAYVFDFDGAELSSRDEHLRIKQYLCREVTDAFGFSPEAVREYFDRYFAYCKKEMQANDFTSCISPFGFSFEKYAQNFRLIDGDSTSLIVQYLGDKEEETYLKELAADGRSAKRKLQKYSLSLRSYEYDRLAEQGVIAERNSLKVLTNFSYYDPETGIRFYDDTDYIV